MSQESANPRTGTDRVKRGMAEMLKGGVIMDVVTPEQARIAEDAGACAVMALERVPADIRAEGGVSAEPPPGRAWTAPEILRTRWRKRLEQRWTGAAAACHVL